MSFHTTVDISFGDCDPAGIVFYPNYYRWFDAAFQAYLSTFGLNQGILRDRLGTIGTGLIDTGATFRAPASYGDVLTLHLADIKWHAKTFRVIYEGRVEDRLVVEGFEVRGVFVRDGERLRAAPVGPLCDLMKDGAT